MSTYQASGALTPPEAHALQSMLREPVRPGLGEAELDDVERRFGFRFAADHRTFLAAGVPVGDRWPDWQHGNPEQLRKRLEWPVDGVLYDVEQNGTWLPDWGPRPTDLTEALAIARDCLTAVPQLIPICGHRYLPGIPESTGYPVLSVYQTDIIYYGYNIQSYLRHEFGGEPLGPPPEPPPRRIEFWSRFID
ncbi:hypothetical protein [Amycolatopsis sp. H20-H5]|uniref:hypothetical protein n=1 Tax=Amycolatopsis sp. H20-H5 TaxID=3046309 RepID=UPI002DB818CA|nr:hypothetical protein [Amycolatopsis sp. H20-H5]MEC3980650.1 hypothetical protein [Amycolatopsis sp. H20-H5]